MENINQLKKEKRRYLNKGNIKQAANVCNLMGIELQETGNYDMALDEHQEEANLCEALGDKIGVAVAHRRMGEVFCDLNDWGKALEHQKKHLALAVECNDLVEQQRAYATIGRTHMRRAESAHLEESKTLQMEALSDSEKAFLAALKKCDCIIDFVNAEELAQMRCRLYHNIGLILDLKDQTTDAIGFVSQALELCNRYKLHDDSYRSYSELSRMHLKIGNNTKALEEAQLSLKCAMKLQNKNEIVDANCLIAVTHIFLDNFMAAKKFYYKAHKLKHPITYSRDSIERKLKQAVQLCILRNAISKPELSDDTRLSLLDKIGDIFVSFEAYKLAILFYKKRLDLAMQNNKDNSYLAPIYSSLAQTYKDMEEYGDSLKYFNTELAIHSNSNSKETVVTLIEIAKVSIIVSESHDKVCEIFEKALKVSREVKSPCLEALTLRNYLVLTGLPQDKKHILESQLKHLRDIHGPDIEWEESVSESDEGEEIDLDLIDFSDSDEESATTSTGRPSRPTRGFKIKKNALGETALHQAVIKGNTSMVKRLLNQNFPVNVRDNSGWLPIHEACNWGHLEIVEALIEAGAWINDRGGRECSGTTPLHDAANNGHFKVVSLLIEKGASVILKNDNGETPLDCLISYSERTDISYSELNQCDQLAKIFVRRMERTGYKVTENLKIKLNNVTKKASGSVEEDCSQDNPLPSLTDDFPFDYDSFEDNIHFNLKQDSDVSKVSDSAADIYKSAIYNMGSHAKKAEAHSSSNHRELKNKTPLICEEDYVVDDWLIDDMETSKKRKRPEKHEFEFKEKIRRKTSPVVARKKQTKQPKLTNLLRRESPSPELNHSPVHVEEPEIEMENVRSSCSRVPNISLKYSSPSPEVTPAPTLRLLVKVFNKNLLVPIASAAQTQTIEWLEEEVSKRYLQLVGVKLNFRLSTISDEVLNSNDEINLVLSADNNKLLASVTGIQELPPLSDRYTQTCQRLGLVPFHDLISTLRECDSSGELNVRMTYVKDSKYLAPFFSSIQHHTIRVLQLNSNSIEDTGMEQLINSLYSLAHLETLEVQACSLSTQSLFAFCKFLKEECTLKNLSDINLSYNDFSETEFWHIKDILSFPSVAVLKLISCGIHLDNFSSENFFSNAQSLYLDDNELGLKSVSYIVSSCPRLKCFSIRGCLSSSSTDLSLGSILSSILGTGSECGLQCLDISDCGVTNDDVEIIASYAYRCSSLSTLKLGQNPRLSSSAVVKLLKEFSESTIIPLKELELHVSILLGKDEDFSTCVSEVIQKKASSPSPLTRLSLPYSDRIKKVTDLWSSVYKEKAHVCIVSNIAFLSIK